MIKVKLIQGVVITTFLVLLSTYGSSQTGELNSTIAEILTQFETNDVVSVIVMFKDTSNFSLNKNDSTHTQKSIISKRTRYFNNLLDKELSRFDKNEFSLRYKFYSINGFVGNITHDGLYKLLGSPHLENIYLNKKIQIALTESSELIHSTDVNNLGYTGQHQTICIIDTGIDYTHPNLGGCTRDAFFNHNCSKVLDGYDFINNDNNASDPDDNGPMDDNNHGTHVAGIAAANGSIQGVAPDARLIALKVCDAVGSCDTGDIVQAIQWCYNNQSIYNISVISISIGNHLEYGPAGADGNCPTIGRDAVNDAYAIGTSISIASGNDGYISGISWPGCLGNATSVGAVYDDDLGFQPASYLTLKGYYSDAHCNDTTAKTDNITCFTNRYLSLDLLAPGAVINSTKTGSTYGRDSGTSMACPHVSGAAAILKQIDDNLNLDDIQSILNQTGTSIVDTGGSRNNGVGTGLTFYRIDIESAIRYVLGCTGSIPPYSNDWALDEDTRCENCSNVLGEGVNINIPVNKKLILKNASFTLDSPAGENSFIQFDGVLEVLDDVGDAVIAFIN